MSLFLCVLTEMNQKEIAALSEALKDAPTTYGDIQVDIITDNHLFKDVLPQSKCSLPYYLVTRQSAILTNNINNNTNDDHNITGSPLKLTEYNPSDYTVLASTGDLYSPLLITEARKILSQYTALVKSSQFTSPLPMWILCKSPDRDATVALGVKNDPAENNRCLFIYTVTVQGPVGKAFSLPKLSTLRDRHCYENEKKIETKCFASYTVLSAMEKDMSGFGEASLLTLEVAWTKCTALLQTPPLEAECKLHVSIGRGDIRSGVHSMYEDLAILLGLSHGLIDGEVKWATDDTDLPVLAQVHKLLEDMGASRAQKRLVSTNNNDNSGDVLLKTLYVVDRHLDFTEQLWQVLKNCASYDELLDALNAVFTAVRCGHLQTITRPSRGSSNASYQRPIIHPRSSSRLADFVRRSFHQSVPAPSLEGIEPLKLLLEIGLEKLRRDYYHLLIGRDLVVASHLQFFLNEDLPLLDQCKRLDLLHTAVELYVLLHQFITLPQLVLSASVRKALTQLQVQQQEQSADMQREFVVPVAAFTVSRFLHSLPPDVWSAIMTSGGAICTCTLSARNSLCHNRPIAKSKDEDSHYLTVIRESISTY